MPDPSPPRSARILTRRRFLSALGASVAGGGAAAVYARHWEPQWLDVTWTTIDLRRATKGTRALRLLHLSDLHASDVVPLSFIDEAVTLGLAQRPDLIALTGDFITSPYQDWNDYGRRLARLSAAAPTVACLGNHDGGVWTQRLGRGYTSEKVQGMLAAHGIELLHNRSVTRTIAGQTVQITGVGDLWAGECQPAIAFWQQPVAPPEAMRLVLNHNPDAKDLFEPYPWDLMLCGHTHGGQFRLPLIGAPFAPVKDKRYIAGRYDWAGRQIYITRGVGNLHGLRFNCRPEVTLLDLV